MSSRRCRRSPSRCSGIDDRAPVVSRFRATADHAEVPCEAAVAASHALQTAPGRVIRLRTRSQELSWGEELDEVFAQGFSAGGARIGGAAIGGRAGLGG